MGVVILFADDEKFQMRIENLAHVFNKINQSLYMLINTEKSF
jgi:hypothetical protein